MPGSGQKQLTCLADLDPGRPEGCPRARGLQNRPVLTGWDWQLWTQSKRSKDQEPTLRVSFKRSQRIGKAAQSATVTGA